MSTSVGISFTTQWTTEYSAAYTSTMSRGKWGIMVSNPRVYRRSGYAKVGYIGSQRSTYFQAGQHFNQDYKGLSWVQGSISLCTSNSYPIQGVLDLVTTIKPAESVKRVGEVERGYLDNTRHT